LSKNIKESDMMKEEIEIVAFGASIVEAVINLEQEQRWTVILENKLNGNSSTIEYTVINSGVGGNTSREGLERIDKDVLIHKPDIVLVQFGGNDSTPEENRAVSVVEYVFNLETIYEKLNAIGAEMILLTFTPIVDVWHKNGKHDKYINNDGLDGYVELYRQATREFAKGKSLRLVDIDVSLRKACEELSPEEIILKDGVHLTAKANEIITETIYNYLIGM
jgi:lysophospholipase L1-like esterase